MILPPEASVSCLARARSKTGAYLDGQQLYDDNEGTYCLWCEEVARHETDKGKDEDEPKVEAPS